MQHGKREVEHPPGCVFLNDETETSFLYGKALRKSFFGRTDCSNTIKIVLQKIQDLYFCS